MNELQKISKDGDLLFLDVQREKGRRGFISEVDAEFSESQRKGQDKQKLAEFLCKE